MTKQIISIAMIDDNPDTLESTKLLFEDVETENTDLKINFDTFEISKKYIESIKMKDDTLQYLILDIYDNTTGKDFAKDVLRAIKIAKKNIKVVLYSGVSLPSGEINQIKYNADDFKFIISELIPKSNEDLLVRTIIEHFLDNNISLRFDYLNRDDILLKAEINSIGENYISSIIRKIKIKKDINTPILIERMSSGFSGASVFKLHINNKFSILKISKDKNKLEEEFRNAEKHYKELPPAFRIEISDRENYSSNGVTAYLIENVPDGETLFNFLKTENDKSIIHPFLEELFINDKCMKSFYLENEIRKEKYYFINKKFDEIKYSKVKMALNELNPLLDTNVSNRILDYIADNKYDKIRPNGTIKENSIVICHGDFHSKNIMISSKKNPTIIDTGGMKEDYWCMDICRLITNLFVEGIDTNTSKYYDISEIPNQLNLVEQIINLEGKLEPDVINDGVIIAINWLMNNIENVYGEMYCKWEYQLGLLKEFLQISYRKNSIPPNKRALAILSANKCLESANELFE